ncbi:MAG: hypothetical protein CL927_13980 [Deltaproteobacteria bacterium]|nr:hypothetical protein [Deltaproteobacteria bacterium]
MNGFPKSSRLALLTYALIGGACGSGGPELPPVPSAEERLETAKLIDEARGFDPFLIGMPLSKVVNVGKPDSYLYVENGVRLSTYRKTRMIVKIGGTNFPDISLFFGKAKEMQMYRFSRSLDDEINDARASAGPKGLDIAEGEEEERLEAFRDLHKAGCESAAGKFAEVWGRGTPQGFTKLVWQGNEVQASWEYTDIRGVPVCLVEVRAVNPR